MNLAELFKKYIECDSLSRERKKLWEDYVKLRDKEKYVPTTYATNKEPREPRSEPTGEYGNKK